MGDGSPSLIFSKVHGLKKILQQRKAIHCFPLLEGKRNFIIFRASWQCLPHESNSLHLQAVALMKEFCRPPPQHWLWGAMVRCLLPGLKGRGIDPWSRWTFFFIFPSSFFRLFNHWKALKEKLHAIFSSSVLHAIQKLRYRKVSTFRTEKTLDGRNCDFRD